VPHTSHGNGQTLKLATRALSDLTLHELLELQSLHKLVACLLALGLLVEDSLQSGVGHLDAAGNLVHVLRLSDCLDVVLENLGEEVLQLATTVVLENLNPLRRVVKATEVGLELASKDLESGTLTDTVGADETENLTWTGRWQSVKLEGVGVVAVGNMGLKVGWQVENSDGFERAPVVNRISQQDSLFDTDTTTNAKLL
jgi:hypothetical protein